MFFLLCWAKQKQRKWFLRWHSDIQNLRFWEDNSQLLLCYFMGISFKLTEILNFPKTAFHFPKSVFLFGKFPGSFWGISVLGTKWQIGGQIIRKKNYKGRCEKRSLSEKSGYRYFSITFYKTGIAGTKAVKNQVCLSCSSFFNAR